jgi:O-antigen ligase
MGSDYGETKSLEFLLYTFPMIIFTVIFINSKEKIWFFIFTIIGVSFAFAILGLFTGDLGSGRLSVLGGGSNVYGRYMVYGVAGILPFFHIAKSKLIKIFNSFFIALFIIMAYFTGSRQAILGILLCIFFYITLYLLKAAFNSKIKILLKAAFFLVIMSLYFPTFIIKSFANSLTWNRLSLLFEEDKGESVSSRMEMLGFAWDMFKEKPIFGWGTGSFADEYSYIMRYPHNLILEIFSELGMIGILIFGLTAVLFILSGYKSFKLTKGVKDVSLVITIVNYLLLSLFFSLVSGDLFDSRWIWLFGTILVAIPYFYNNDSVGDRHEKYKDARFIRTVLINERGNHLKAR